MKPPHLIDDLKDIIASYLDHYRPNVAECLPRNAICITVCTRSPPNQSKAPRRDQVIIALQSLFEHTVPVLPNPESLTDESDQIHSILGQEHLALILDCTAAWPDNALGAAAGCVKAPGTLFFLIPEELDSPDHSAPFDQHFKRELCKVFVQDPRCPLLWSIYPLASESSPSQALYNGQRLPWPDFTEQNAAVAALQQRCLSDARSTDLLLARRGRGKSAALGLLIKRLCHTQSALTKNKLTLTSPHKNQVATVLKHANSDWLVHTPLQIALRHTGDTLIVDEAGSVPLPVLKKLQANYQHVIFAGTVDGYEGAGRALAIRLAGAAIDPKSVQQDVQSHRLHHPIRWPINDPVEKLVHKILRLETPEPPTVEIPAEPAMALQLQYERVTPQRLLDNTNLLDEIFGLLLQAHYQTTSKDLKHLLNQQQMRLWTQSYNGNLTGACLLAHEGGLSEALQTEIRNGNRRPSHQKLPMLLHRQCHVPDVLKVHHWRIVRIAIKPAYQRRGLGQHFLNALQTHIESNRLEAQSSGDFLGASFGATEEGYRFWVKADFHAVHLGFKLNPRSGQRALAVIKSVQGATSRNEDAVRKAHRNFIDNLQALNTLCQLRPHWLSLLYPDNTIDTRFISELTQTTIWPTKNDTLNPHVDDEKRLTLWKNNQLALHDIWGPLARSSGGVDQLASLSFAHPITAKQLTNNLKNLPTIP